MRNCQKLLTFLVQFLVIFNVSRFEASKFEFVCWLCYCFHTCGFDSLDHTILLFGVVVDDENEFILFVVMLYFVLC
jgi:hypothetical protein